MAASGVQNVPTSLAEKVKRDRNDAKLAPANNEHEATF
jgi:hypothetical protein